MRDAAPTKGVDHEPAGATTVRFCLPIAEQKPAAIVQGQSPFVRGGNADTPRSYAAAMPGKGSRTDSTAAGSCFGPRAELSEGRPAGRLTSVLVGGEATAARMTRLASLSRTRTRRRSGSPSSTGTPALRGRRGGPDLETGAAIRDGQAAGMSGALEAYGGPTEGVCVTKVCGCGTH